MERLKQIKQQLKGAPKTGLYKLEETKKEMLNFYGSKLQDLEKVSEETFKKHCFVSELIKRCEQKERRSYIRENKPLFVIDFWNDAPYVGGCIAAREYIHINHRGDVEPCIFTHFAQVNIKNTSLKESMNCQFFKKIRKRQPYSSNLYLPCMLIDHPEISRGFYKNCHIYPTHDGAECLFSDIAGGLDEYSKGVRDIYTDVWKKEKELFCKEEAPQKKVVDK